LKRTKLILILIGLLIAAGLVTVGLKIVMTVTPKGSETDLKEASQVDEEAVSTQEPEIKKVAKVPGKPKYLDAKVVGVMDLPPLPEGTVLFEEEKMFGYRGRIGGFFIRPCKVGVYRDDKVYVEGGEPMGIPEFKNEFELGKDPAKGSIKVMYKKVEKELTFCGSYVILLADLTRYQTMTFMIKGEKGGETFIVGLNDVISNKREDAVYVGSIHRYLPEGITTDWQEVKIPLSDFYGPSLSAVYSLVFEFNEPGQGAFYVDQIRFHTEELVDRVSEVESQGYLLLDNFDHSLVNLLGRKANAYKKLPSVCKHTITQDEQYEGTGSLRLEFDKKGSGWCGYYTLLNQVDGEYYDLSMYGSVSFMVKGRDGGELFEIGMADKSWVIIGDSLKAGPIDKYLPGGVTKEWQEVVIPLGNFGALDLSEMGSFVINFHKVGNGAVYIDNLKFIKKSQEDLLKEWEEGW